MTVHVRRNPVVRSASVYSPMDAAVVKYVRDNSAKDAMLEMFVTITKVYIATIILEHAKVKKNFQNINIAIQ